ncbi:DUF6221 family protein [Streptomyces europaeiscabiei]|uniref:DUF6221 family protein n=1 Tax=Streptomyces europaeiscabiei TaxID=146819 RepID=UPI0029BA6EE2|nr:DUF6221 family protein [Streptomyces europaeiscabiei]MDX3582524.1 DUF6221 family protein [Streptomyces europaeiscabiei]
MDEICKWLSEQVDEDERIARAASGGTVVGEPGNWQPAPGGDEWEAAQTDCDEDELLVALRPGLPRPPDVMSGMWGQVICYRPEFEDYRDASPLPQLEHAARHDPARALRETAANRRRLERHTPQMMVGHDSDENDPSTYVLGCPTCQVGVVSEGDWPCEEIRDMAASYTDRPGYHKDWDAC